LLVNIRYVINVSVLSDESGSVLSTIEYGST